MVEHRRYASWPDSADVHALRNFLHHHQKWKSTDIPKKKSELKAYAREAWKKLNALAQNQYVESGLY
jgi:hypothetical protein